MKDRIIAITLLLALLAVVFTAGVAADSKSEARRLQRQVDILAKKLEAHEEAQKYTETRTKEDIKLLDQHVDFFIQGGWK